MFANIKYQYVETLELKHLACVAHNGVDHFNLRDPYVQRQLDESKVVDVIVYSMMLICHWTRTVCLKPYGIHSTFRTIDITEPTNNDYYPIHCSFPEHLSRLSGHKSLHSFSPSESPQPDSILPPTTNAFLLPHRLGCFDDIYVSDHVMPLASIASKALTVAPMRARIHPIAARKLVLMTTPYLSGSWHVVRLIAELINMIMALGQVLPLLGYPSIERDRCTYVSILHTITSRYPFRLRSPFVLSQPTPSTSNHIHTILDSVFPTRTDVT